jgi:hypothetical protein
MPKRVAATLVILLGLTGYTDPILAGTPYSFVVLGDNRAGGGNCQENADFRSILSMVANEASIGFLVHLGDMTTGYDDTTCFASPGSKCTLPTDNGNVSEMIAELQSRPPRAGLAAFYYPVIGNHELSWYPDACGQTMCDVFDMRSYFVSSAADPNDVFKTSGQICNGTEALTDYRRHFHYAFNYKNARFVVAHWTDDYYGPLSCNNQDCLTYCVNESIPFSTRRNYCYNLDEWERLVRDLEAGQNDPAIDHIFVFMHAVPHPTQSYGHGQTYGGAQLIAKLNQYGKVRIVFNGHNHDYERTYPLDANQQVAAGGNGVTFITSGGAGSDLHGTGSVQSTTAVYSAVKHYVRVDVDDNSITVVARDIGNNVIDTHTIGLSDVLQEDFNGDGAVDSLDLGMLLSKWDTSNTTYDLDDSGTVDAGDLAALLGSMHGI